MRKLRSRARIWIQICFSSKFMPSITSPLVYSYQGHAYICIVDIRLTVTFLKCGPFVLKQKRKYIKGFVWIQCGQISSTLSPPCPAPAWGCRLLSAAQASQSGTEHRSYRPVVKCMSFSYHTSSVSSAILNPGKFLLNIVPCAATYQYSGIFL